MHNSSVPAYCIVATESAGRQIPMVFLEMIKEDFNKRYAGAKAATTTANSLTRDFGLRLRDQMQYCTDHLEEVSKLSKVKAQVEQVKSIMMENIDKARSASALTLTLRALSRLSSALSMTTSTSSRSTCSSSSTTSKEGLEEGSLI